MEQDYNRHDNQAELNRLITTMNKHLVSSGQELWDHFSLLGWLGDSSIQHPCPSDHVLYIVLTLGRRVNQGLSNSCLEGPGRNINEYPIWGGDSISDRHI